MTYKYNVKWPKERGNTGVYDKSGSIKLNMKGMSRGEVDKVAHAINIAIGERED
ncbi:hypothetical protein KAR91_09315 [Candidatus Pacearchaeota archaeon]|nr:hypothetical protein [Candidatus Pacearchaeota archaeon]